MLGWTHTVPHGSGNYQAGVWLQDLFFGPLCSENTLLYHQHFLIKSHKARSDCPCTEGGFWSEILGTLRNRSEVMISYPLTPFSFTNIGIRDHIPVRVGTLFCLTGASAHLSISVVASVLNEGPVAGRDLSSNWRLHGLFQEQQ